MTRFQTQFKQLAAFGVLSAASLTAQASLVFDFAFTNTNTISSVAGTVVGKFYGLSDNASGADSQLVIESFPSGLHSVSGTGPIAATLWDQQYDDQLGVPRLS